MAKLELMQELHTDAATKIVLLVLDGLGGLPIEPGGPTELEAAHTPSLDRLASQGVLGQIIPIARGITPGSGPAHLALFGYDPLRFEVGRGVLEATGIGMDVAKGEIAARGNFCTVDKDGRIIDRRAGRIPTPEAIPLVERLAKIELEDLRFDVRHVREYRFALIMRGQGLEPDIEDTDPQRVGAAPLHAKGNTERSEKTAGYFNSWIEKARQILADEPKANAVTLRGFSTAPDLPNFKELYGLKAACIAVYPMYRGVSKLVGMTLQEFEGTTPEDEFAAVKECWGDYDYFFVHIKRTDSTGEDGDFSGKVKVIEEVDAALATLIELKPDVIAVTGDHSTPASMRKHTWHPVPFLLWAPATARPDTQTEFGERACSLGGLGTFKTQRAMQLMMAHAGRLDKYGA